MLIVKSKLFLGFFAWRPSGTSGGSWEDITSARGFCVGAKYNNFGCLNTAVYKDSWLPAHLKGALCVALS
ncbi:hypothetical protein AAX09_10520 (plasmid) [Moraxella bovoculi]|nr:hypothetical protein AAX09_10520 [Moraxella bovoculi]